jgi:hypothetical protein
MIFVTVNMNKGDVTRNARLVHQLRTLWNEATYVRWKQTESRDGIKILCSIVCLQICRRDASLQFGWRRLSQLI